MTLRSGGGKSRYFSHSAARQLLQFTQLLGHNEGLTSQLPLPTFGRTSMSASDPGSPSNPPQDEQVPAPEDKTEANPYIGKAQPKSGKTLAEENPPEQSGDSAAPKITGQQIAMFVGALTAVAVAYWWTAWDLINVWDTDPNYSHGFVVPFFALGLGWVAYTRHNVAPVNKHASRRALIIGMIEIGFGFLLHMASMFLGKIGLLFDVVALIFIVLGIIMVLGGEKANKAYGLPVFFLIFMAPLPAPVYQPVALAMQNLASIVAVSLFDLCGIAAYRNGYLIDIPGPHDMEVGAACSGLRSLTAVLALAVAIAYLSNRSMAYRAVLVVMAAPVAIIINCLRVFGTGLIMMYIGPEWATGAAHTNEGMVMVGVAAAILALIAWLMAGIEDWIKERKAPSDPASSAVQPV